MKFLRKYYHDFGTALEAIITNRVKSFLTALGIVFGVAAVISMLAIGRGAKQEILEQMKMVGVNNIVITPIIDKDGESSENSENEDEEAVEEEIKKQFSKGLSLEDARALAHIIPTIELVSPQVSDETVVIKNGRSKKARINGVRPEHFDLFNLELEKGKFFNSVQDKYAKPVCIIGHGIKIKVFKDEEPIGQYIKCGDVWLKVIGVLESRLSLNGVSEDLKLTNVNEEIYIPINTMLLRFINRASINENMVKYSWYFEDDHPDWHYNQLDKIVVQVGDAEQIVVTSKLIEKMLDRRHSGAKDFEITVPELLLKQQQRTKDIFNIVLGAIAGISLLVGGIGIMNIMLASVMERIREIGTRQALGATKKDIIVQFLAESTLISVSGGVIGIVLGIVMAKMITRLADILTVISFGSIVVAFGVSVFVGIIFGYMPAKRAAEKDPVESLRYE